LQSYQRIDDFKRGGRQVSTVAVALQVVNGELSGAVIHEAEAAGYFIFIEIFFEAVINGYIVL